MAHAFTKTLHSETWCVMIHREWNIMWQSLIKVIIIKTNLKVRIFHVHFVHFLHFWTHFSVQGRHVPRSARAMHVPCTCHARAMHLPCTCHAPAMHLPCTCSARAGGRGGEVLGLYYGHVPKGWVIVPYKHTTKGTYVLANWRVRVCEYVSITQNVSF